MITGSEFVINADDLWDAKATGNQRWLDENFDLAEECINIGGVVVIEVQPNAGHNRPVAKVCFG